MIDVLVIGAGPAGNNAALELARKGYSVTVIDRRETVGDKLCSGIVGASCLRRFPIAPGHIYRSASAGRVHVPNGQSMRIGRPDPQAYIVDRVGYVASFSAKARQAGADYLLGHEVRSIEISPHSVTAMVTNGSGPQPLQARSLVIASGFGSPMVKLAGLPEASDYLIGTQVEVLAPGAEEIQVWLGRGVAPGSFAWLVPTTDGRALLGLMARRQGTTFLEMLIKRLQTEGKIGAVTKAASRWGIPIRPLSRTYRDRVLVVGDAAGQVKPATGGGIFYSFLSSELAAQTLDTALRNDNLSSETLSPYETQWRALLGNELESAYTARRLFERLGDRQLNYLFSIMSSDGLATKLIGSDDVSFDFHSGLLRHVLRVPGVQQTLGLLSAMGSGPARTELLEGV